MTPDERAARVHYHEYSGEGIREHAERIVALEELVMDLYEGLNCPTERDEGCLSCAFNSDDGCMFELRMRELGVSE